MTESKKTELALVAVQLRSKLHSGEDLEIDTSRRQAAVALVLREHSGFAELLMIKRAANPNDFWSGHLALPGGRRQSEDTDLKMTAIRETREEVGVDLSDGGEVLGRLDPVTPVSTRLPNITITPYVAVAPAIFHSSNPETEDQPLQINHEVAVAFWVPVDFLKRDGRSAVVSHIIEGHNYEWPAYASVHGPVWGLTERILTQFLSLLD
jgi:8-oxo-dGTP pyrophosphatase MutT (NUDIX family)